MAIRTDFKTAQMRRVASIVAFSLLCAGVQAGAPLSMDQRLAFSKRPLGFVESVAATGPLAYYRLNAMSGASEIGGTHYRAMGSVSIASPGAPINVANNRFAKLDGQEGSIETTQAGGIGKAASMMAWVNLAALPSDAKHIFYVMGESQNGNDLDLQFEDDNALKFYTASGSHLTFTPKPSTLINQWHFIVVTVNTATKARVIYWDGDEVASDKEGGMPNKTGILSIGESTVFGGRFFQGGIEEAALWDRALSDDEVNKIYVAGQNAAH